jgi:hypothetical protein
MSWPVAVAARLLEGLLRYPVTAQQVRDRTISLGLLRHPTPGQAVELTAKALSRLLLFGYHLPAHAGGGTLPELEEQLRAGRRVFVLTVEGDTALVYQVLEVRSEPLAEMSVAVREVGTPFVLERSLALESFAAGWAAAGNALAVAVGKWNDLPVDGPTFFGGLRDRDGTYHWFSAECDTDAAGNLMRC